MYLSIKKKILCFCYLDYICYAMAITQIDWAFQSVNTVFALQQKFVEEGLDATTKEVSSAAKDADSVEWGDARQHTVF
jgi:hypothetical protein